MTVTCAYSSKNYKVVLSQVYEGKRELATLDALNSCLRLNLELMNRPFLCEAGLVSSMHKGTVQYASMLIKHDTPLWLATKNFRGTIDFYYIQFQWPFQVRFHPQGFLNYFVIERLKEGFIVPLFTRQIKKEQTNLSKAHEKFAWESIEQIRQRNEYKLGLTAR